MKTLLILRHAKSDWNDPKLDDHDRPLNSRGERDAPRVGELLREHALLPDRVLCSTALRARQTIAAVTTASGYVGDIEYLKPLYLAEPPAYLRALGQLPDTIVRVLVVGHNPGLEDLLKLLTNRIEAMPTASLAQIALPLNGWSELSPQVRGDLINVWRPKEL